MIITRNIEPKVIHQKLSEILYRTHINGPVSQDDFETLAYIKKFYPDEFVKFENQFLFCSGLFYKTREADGILELAYSTIRDAIQLDTKNLYTPVQAKEYKDIQTHKYYSFSAPTSTGKSYLFQDIIKNCDNDIVIVLPSRALIAEYLCKIQKLVPKDVLVLQFVENVNALHTRRKVYIITPERSDDLFVHKDDLNVGLLLFDEAQISEEEIRGLRFDALVRKTIISFPEAKKVFAHPFVSNPGAQLQRNLIKNDCASRLFLQNSVGKIYLIKKENGEFETFSPFHLNSNGFPSNDVIEEALNNGKSVLFYVSKTQLYSDEFETTYQKYIRQCDDVENEDALKIIESLHQYIGDSNTGEKRSRLVTLMKKGIVIHHGSMPLRIRLLIEEFVRLKCAKLCFATSTLIQGINMPFDVVSIDNFKFYGSDSKKVLDLKNLIGRAGRTTETVGQFDYGYVVISSRNKNIFTQRLCSNATLSAESKLNMNIDDVDEDNKDIVEAIQNDAFDYDLKITNLQKQRIEKSNIFESVSFVLDRFIKNRNAILKADEYYALGDAERKRLKQAFARIYTVHLRRQELSNVEKAVLSTAIPIILWRVQGKSFKEIISLRQSYLTQKSTRALLKTQLKLGRITREKFNKMISSLGLKVSLVAVSLPNRHAPRVNLFEKDSVFDFDTLIYDTYDYIDKVIGQSLTEPICAVLKMFASAKEDYRAELLANYIRYGTNDETCIWLMKYGFSLDDMDWLVPCVDSVDQNEIKFNDKIAQLDDIQRQLIGRYLQ